MKKIFLKLYTAIITLIFVFNFGSVYAQGITAPALLSPDVTPASGGNFRDPIQAQPLDVTPNTTQTPARNFGDTITAPSVYDGSSLKPDSKLDYSGWVQCDGVVTKGETYRQVECNFANLVNMARYLINWVFMISIPVIIGLFAYSGFLYMTGKKGNIDKAKKILLNAVIGFIIMLGAWFIVTTLLKWLLSDAFQSAAGSLIETQK